MVCRTWAQIRPDYLIALARGHSVGTAVGGSDHLDDLHLILTRGHYEAGDRMVA